MKLHLSTIATLVAVQTLAAQGTLEAVEPNNTTATATPLATGAQAYGDLTAGDEDWYKITLTSTSDLKVFAGPGFAGQCDDTRVRIYAADGTTILIDVDDGNTAGQGYYSTFTVGGYAAGDYYVSVRGYSATTAGSYTLDVVAAAPGTYAAVLPPLTPVNEAAENNDPRPAFGSGTATTSAVFTRNLGNTIAGGTSGTSELTVGKDYDFYELVVTTTGVHTFDTRATTTAPTPIVDDTVIRLLDSSFTSLGFNDDTGGTYSLLSFNITTPGTYYLCVSGYYGTSAGNYYLDIAGPTAPLPTGPSTVTIQAGGCAGSAGTPALGTRATISFPAARPERAVLGSTFYLDGTNLPASAPLFRVIGFGALAVPFDLTGLGAPGCQVEVDPLSAVLSFSDAGGAHFWEFALPGGLVFVGLTLEQQLVVFDPPANGLGVTVSNRVSSVCGITH